MTITLRTVILLICKDQYIGKDDEYETNMVRGQYSEPNFLGIRSYGNNPLEDTSPYHESLS